MSWCKHHTDSSALATSQISISIHSIRYESNTKNPVDGNYAKIYNQSEKAKGFTYRTLNRA
jgi:hypothetical protein